jgi:hypothetical protein
MPWQAVPDKKDFPQTALMAAVDTSSEVRTNRARPKRLRTGNDLRISVAMGPKHVEKQR